MDRFCDRCGKKIIKGTLCDYCDGRVDGYRAGYSDGKERGVIEGVSKGRADAFDEIRDRMVFIPWNDGIHVRMSIEDWNELFSLNKEHKDDTHNI